MIQIAESVDTSVDKDVDMTNLLDCGFKLDFLESIDVSDFNYDNNKTCEESKSDKVGYWKYCLDTSRRTKQKWLEPKTEKKPLSKLYSHSRYASPCTDEQIVEAARGVVPVNTDNSTRWAVENFYGMGRKLACTDP